MGSFHQAAGIACVALLTSQGYAQEKVPDMSGMWARTTFALEQPKSGPGPVRTIRLRSDEKGDAQFNLGDENSPILKPAAVEAIKRRNALQRQGANVPTPSNQCTPMIVPYIYRVQGMQMVQGKDEVVLMYLQNHEVRHVRLNSSHPANLKPSASGDSIGHYEGNTLVVDTIGFAVGRIPVVDAFGSPHSEALHVVERYRLIPYEEARAAQESNVRANGGTATEQAAAVDPEYKGPGLQVEFIVEDETYFTTPWSGLATYRKAMTSWGENVCAENTNEYYNGSQTAVPQADKPDF